VIAGAVCTCGRCSLIDAAGYHVTGGTVYYLKAFPGKAFEVFDQTNARDQSNVYLDGARAGG
jgi:hypothetical protein